MSLKNLPKKPKQSFLNKIADTFWDANTDADKYRRAVAQKKVIASGAGYAPSANYDPRVPKYNPNQTYVQQQKAAGNKRPANNVAQAFMGNALRLGNTVAQLPEEVVDTARMQAAVMTNNQAALKASNQRILDRQKERYTETHGLGGAGTLYQNGNLPTSMSEGIKTTAPAMVGAFGELMPGGGNAINAVTKTAIPLARRVATGAAYGAGSNFLSDVGDQSIQTGKYDPIRGATAAAMGGVFGGTVPVATTAVSKTANALQSPLKQVVDNVKERGSHVAQSLSENNRALGQAGYVQIGRTPKNIHPEDQGTMSDMVDMVNGRYNPKTTQDLLNLETEADHIAKRYGITKPGETLTPKQLASRFIDRLSQENEKPKVAPKRGFLGLGESGKVSTDSPLVPAQQIAKGINKVMGKTDVDNVGRQSVISRERIDENHVVSKIQQDYTDVGFGKINTYETDFKYAGGGGTTKMYSFEVDGKESKKYGRRGDAVNGALKAQQAANTKKIEAEVAAKAKAKPVEESTTEISPKSIVAAKRIIESITPKEEPKPKVTTKKPVKPATPPVEPPVKPKVSPKKTKEPVKTLEEAVYGANIPEASTKGGTNIVGVKHGFSPITKVTKGIQNTATTAVEAGLTSGKKAAYVPSRAVQMVFGTAGQRNETQKMLRQRRGQANLGGDMGIHIEKKTHETLKAAGLDYSKDAALRRRLQNALDPEVAKARGDKPVILSKAEKQVVKELRTIADAAHEEAYALGIINKATYKKNKGKYLTRAYENYEFPKDMQGHWEKNGLKAPTDLKKTRTRKLNEKNSEKLITDPVYLISKQLDFVERTKAIHDFANSVAGDSKLVADEPKVGYRHLADDKAYGALSGKYVRTDMYESIMGFGSQSETLGTAYKLLNMWERNPVRQTYKKVRTIYNPGVRVGNRVYNHIIHTNLGIMPHETALATRELSKALKNNDPRLLMLKKMGITHSDITSYELKTRAKVRASKEEDALVDKVTGLITGMDTYVGDTYGLVDDHAKEVAFFALVNKGLSEADAADQVARAYQDYGAVGKLWDISAKVPIFGKPFGRFTGDFVRRSANLAADKPLTSIAMLAGLYMVGEAMSNVSGESNEDKKTREDRQGAGKIPFTDISTEIQTPWGAVDVRRYIGPSVIMDNNTSPFDQSVSGILPFSNPTSRNDAGELEVNAKEAGSDPAIGPLVQQALDRNFTQKPITDPDYYEQTSSGDFKGAVDPLSGAEKLANRGKELVKGYSAPIATSIAGLFSGEKDTEDKKKIVANNLGVKYSTYDKEDADKTRSNNKYFDETKPQLDSIKKEYLTDVNKKNLWESIHPTTKDRKDNNIQDRQYGDTARKARIYMDHPDLYEMDKKIAQVNNKQDGRPIDPMFNLDDTKRKVLLNIQEKNAIDPRNNSARALKEQNPWLEDFYKERSAYYDDTKKFFDSVRSKTGSSDISDDERGLDPMGVKIVQATPDVQKKLETVKAMTDPAERGQYYADNPEITKYFKDLGNYNNTKRAFLGLPLRDPYPEPTAEVKKLLDQFNTLPKGDGPKGGNKSRYLFVQAHPEVADYWTNKAAYDLAEAGELAVFEGFGFGEEDIKDMATIARAAGGSSSSGGSSGPRTYGSSNASDYAVSLNAGGSVRKPSVKQPKGGSGKVTRKQISKPKVSLKKAVV